MGVPSTKCKQKIDVKRQVTIHRLQPICNPNAHLQKIIVTFQWVSWLRWMGSKLNLNETSFNIPCFLRVLCYNCHTMLRDVKGCSATHLQPICNPS